MITLGKRGDLHARRLALAELRSQDVVHQLFAEVAPRFAERQATSRPARRARQPPRRNAANRMLLLGAILLAIFVLPSPWGIVAILAGGLIDIAESLVLLKWSRRRRAVTGVEALIGKTAVVSSPTQARVAGEIWEVRSDRVLVPGDEVVVHGVEGLTLLVD